MSAIAGAMLVGGLVAIIVGIFVKKIRLLFPPVITGTVVFTIGLSLYSTATNQFCQEPYTTDSGRHMADTTSAVFPVPPAI